jgi:hypothetical protein
MKGADFLAMDLLKSSRVVIAPIPRPIMARKIMERRPNASIVDER